MPSMMEGPLAQQLSAAARGAQGVSAVTPQPQATSLQDLLLQLAGGQNPEQLLQLLALLAGAGGVPAMPQAAADDQSDIAAAFMGR